MGYAKRIMMEQQERGWTGLEGFVCAGCLSDPYLKRVCEDSEANLCTYCGDHRGCIAGDALMEIIADGIRHDWTDPDTAGVPYEGREGGYQFPLHTTWELFDEIGWPFENDQLAEDVVNAFINEEWFWLYTIMDNPAENLADGWNRFKEYVKNDSRFLFLVPRPDPEIGSSYTDVAPHEMLEKLGTTIEDAGAIIRIEAGTQYFRARPHAKGGAPASATDLGTAPAAKYSNRMSPVGIPMFYGSVERNTALVETANAVGTDSEYEYLTSGAFVAAQDLHIVDLASGIEVPSLFDPGNRYKYWPAQFIDHFAEDLAESVTNDELERLEYVPTQIVTEYVRHFITGGDGEPIDGILYRSSQVPGGRSIVLFVENKQCADSEASNPAPTLILDHSTLETRPIASLRR